MINFALLNQLRNMQDYIELRIDSTPCNENITDLLAAFLCDVGFESFVSDTSGLTAYIKKELYEEANIKEIIDNFPMTAHMQYNVEEVKGEDWNEEWEKNYFQPIIIGNRCVVHSTFHKDIPVAEYDIVIDPKMAFGTGHHSTTSNMMKYILDSEMEGKSVIDMGTGTGILAILSKMRGASKVTGIEIDPFACENAIENVALNHVDVKILCGDATTLEKLEPADYFFANINRNVITDDISNYAKSLKSGGIMYLSGFYKEDIPIVSASATKENLELVSTLEDNNWVALKLVKRN